MASKEEMIRDRFERFLDRVFRLQEQLSANEPENATRLARVVERAGELGLAEQLDQIIRLLRDSPALTETVDAQDRWVQDADRLLAILLERDSDNEQRKQQIEGLQAYKQQLEEILEREQGLRDKTGRAAQAEDASEQGGEQNEEWDHLKEAEKQRDVADSTGELAEKMRQDAEAHAGAQGRPGSAGAPSPSSGAAQSLEQGQRDMNDAAEKLEENDPAQAGESQDRALEELKQAQKELEEVLNQLRQEDREETLRDLEGRFREMLSQQNAINAATDRLAGARIPSRTHTLDRESLLGPRRLDREDVAGARIPSRTHVRENPLRGPYTSFRRAEKLQLADLATKERDLAQRASVCGHVLDEEGTTIVFPHVVGQLAEDMHSAADRLASHKVGSITRDIEQEIVDTLEQLLEAIKTMQQENEQQAGSAGNSSGGQPLLPPSAELKLLRSSQVRVNSRTAVIEAARVEGTESPAALAGLLETTATRQAQCAQIAEETRDRQNRP